MIKTAGQHLHNHLLNFRGPRIGRKVIVFESDDWGSIRIPSLAAFNALVKAGIPLQNNPYNRFDSLESEDDLCAMLEVIESYKDHRGNHPIITTNFIVANPDFEKIEKSNFEEYHYETVLETYKQKSETQNSWAIIQEAISKKLIRPQFHGREHLNATRWLEYLRSGHAHYRKAFQQRVFCIDHFTHTGKRTNLMATLDYENQGQRDFAYEQLRDGANLFRRLFQMPSASFIAPCNVWDSESEKILAESGVRFLQSFRGQLLPSPGAPTYQKRIHRSGERSLFNQTYLVRNVYFEPSTLSKYPWIDKSLKKIHAAFFWDKPAIISMHRLNSIGSLSIDNRSRNLKMLGALLVEILKRWPEVEFMSSDELGHLYEKSTCAE
jgi:hypothetical protein